MQEVPVNVFWDIENCAVPANMKGDKVVNAIRSFALQRGFLKNISAFANLKLIKDDLRADLQESGVLLHDVARKTNSSDLAILVEFLKLVIDYKPPHCIVLISGDRDFANVLSVLTFRKYQVYLIHSPQASEVLKNAATEAFEWNQLLNKGGSSSSQSHPFSNGSITLQGQYDKFQPLVDFLLQKGKPQVEFSELGNLIPFSKYGYPKLKDYIFDAQNAGLVKCGAIKNIYWVMLPANGHSAPVSSTANSSTNIPSPPVSGSVASSSMGINLPMNTAATPLTRTPPTDRKQVIKHLTSALDSLRKDYFRPTEGTVLKRIKQMNLPLQKMDWEDIVTIAKTNNFFVEGEKPNRVIYPQSGPFEGVDPSHPNSDKFSNSLWKTLHQFFSNSHPIVRVGRYGFAVFLKEEGPPEVREMPLGSITELVQLALHRQLLRYHKTQVSTIPPEELGTDLLSPRNDNFGFLNLNTGFYESGDDLQLLSPSDQYPSYDPLDGADSMGIQEDDPSRMVPVSFIWPYPGTSVLVTGSFFSWRNTIALHKSRERDAYGGSNCANPLLPTPTQPLLPLPTNSIQPLSPVPSFSREKDNIYFGVNGAMVEAEDVFSTVLYLPPGKYEYKFIVDGAWHYDPHQSVVTDEVGNLNNIVVIDLSKSIDPLSTTTLVADEQMPDHDYGR